MYSRGGGEVGLLDRVTSDSQKNQSKSKHERNLDQIKKIEFCSIAKSDSASVDVGYSQYD